MSNLYRDYTTEPKTQPKPPATDTLASTSRAMPLTSGENSYPHLKKTMFYLICRYQSTHKQNEGECFQVRWAIRSPFHETVRDSQKSFFSE